MTIGPANRVAPATTTLGPNDPRRKGKSKSASSTRFSNAQGRVPRPVVTGVAPQCRQRPCRHRVLVRFYRRYRYVCAGCGRHSAVIATIATHPLHFLSRQPVWSELHDRSSRVERSSVPSALTTPASASPARHRSASPAPPTCWLLIGGPVHQSMCSIAAALRNLHYHNRHHAQPSLLHRMAHPIL